MPITRSHIEYAARRCLDLEKNDHCEHAVALDKNGDVVFEHHGDDHHISFQKYEEDGTLKKVHTLVHNHPKHGGDSDGGSSLSPEDMAFAKSHNINIWAVGENGNRFWSTGFKQDVSSGLMFMLARTDYEFLSSVIIHDFSRMVHDEHKMSEGEFIEIAGHVVNLMARKNHMIDYNWELGESTQKVFDKYLPYINQRCGGDIFEVKPEEETDDEKDPVESLVKILMGLK